MHKQHTRLYRVQVNVEGAGATADPFDHHCWQQQLVVCPCMQMLLTMHHVTGAGVQLTAYDAFLLYATLMKFRLPVLVIAGLSCCHVLCRLPWPS